MGARPYKLLSNWGWQVLIVSHLRSSPSGGYFNDYNEMSAPMTLLTGKTSETDCTGLIAHWLSCSLRVPWKTTFPVFVMRRILAQSKILPQSGESVSSLHLLYISFYLMQPCWGLGSRLVKHCSWRTSAHQSDSPAAMKWAICGKGRAQRENNGFIYVRAPDFPSWLP